MAVGEVLSFPRQPAARQIQLGRRLGGHTHTPTCVWQFGQSQGSRTQGMGRRRGPQGSFHRRRDGTYHHDTQPLAPWVRAGRQEISGQMANGHMVPEMSPLQIVLSGFRTQAQGIHGDRTGCSRAINGRWRCKHSLEYRHRPERYGDPMGILFRGPTTWATQWPQ